MKLGDVLLAILLLPVVIAGAIAIMAMSYMLVPVMMVLFIGTITYIVVQGNKGP